MLTIVWASPELNSGTLAPTVTASCRRDENDIKHFGSKDESTSLTMMTSQHRMCSSKAEDGVVEATSGRLSEFSHSRKSSNKEEEPTSSTETASCLRCEDYESDFKHFGSSTRSHGKEELTSAIMLASCRRCEDYEGDIKHCGSSMRSHVGRQGSEKDESISLT